jgi:hypothetical protein
LGRGNTSGEQEETKEEKKAADQFSFTSVSMASIKEVLCFPSIFAL